MGISSMLQENVPDFCREYLINFGFVFLLCIGYKCYTEIWPLVDQFLLGRLFGPALDLKRMGKWAVVTGSTDGIGLAYAHELAKMGINVVLISRTQEKLDRTAREIEKKYGVQTKTISFDFTQSYDNYGIIRKALDDLEIGILVNNVGLTAGLPLFFHETQNNEKKVNDILNCNAVSTTMMTNIVLPGMVSRRRGLVISISSFTGVYPFANLNIYPATKAFMDSFSRSMSQEYQEFGIHFQSVIPHYVATKVFQGRISENILFPSAENYVKSAIRTIGRANRTYGYFVHYIQACIASAFGEPHYYNVLLKKEFMNARQVELRKLGLLPKD